MSQYQMFSAMTDQEAQILESSVIALQLRGNPALVRSRALRDAVLLSRTAVELASDMKRALTLAADEHFRVAIVAPGPSLSSVRNGISVTRRRAKNDRGR
jgi:hypothetical protein